MEQWVDHTPQIVNANYKYTKAYIYKDGAFRRVRVYVYTDKSRALTVADNAIVDQAIAN